jgi:hypothetical protein
MSKIKQEIFQSHCYFYFMREARTSRKLLFLVKDKIKCGSNCLGAQAKTVMLLEGTENLD